MYIIKYILINKNIQTLYKLLYKLLLILNNIYNKMRQINQLEPKIDIYSYKIENTSSYLQNSFNKGFKLIQDKKCGIIYTDNIATDNVKTNISSCDLIETDNEDWESVIKLNLETDFMNEETTQYDLIKDVYYIHKKLSSRQHQQNITNNKIWKHFCSKWGNKINDIILNVAARYHSYICYSNIKFRLERLRLILYMYQENINVNINEELTSIQTYQRIKTYMNDNSYNLDKLIHNIENNIDIENILADIGSICKYMNITSISNQIQDNESDVSDVILDIIYNITDKEFNYVKSVTKTSYIANIKLDKSEKLVVIGDIHGSVHTFIRHIFRFSMLGIINLKTLEVKQGYKILFLGDVVDRGLFSMEILSIIFYMMYINNKNIESPIVIYNRGNHEHIDINSRDGMLYEFSNRCPNTNLYYVINELYTYFASAHILQVSINKKQYRYWLCHGGFTPNLLDPKSSLTQKVKDINNLIIQFEDVDQQEDVRWSDFDDSYVDNPIDRHPVFGVRGGAGYGYNRYHVTKFLETTNINFIIRGHQDNYDNNYLFSNEFNILDSDKLIPNKDNIPNQWKDFINNLKMPGFGFDFLSTFQLNIKGINNKDIVVFNRKFISGNRVEGPIALLYPDVNIFNSKQLRDNSYRYANVISNDKDVLSNDPSQSLIVFPVLTISTNSDNNRILKSDSFIILHFD